MKISVKKNKKIHFEKQLTRLQKQWYDDSPYFEVQTSGSTGVPKKIALKKAHLRASAEATIKQLGLQPGCSALLCLPADKIGGIMMWLRAEIGQWELELRPPSGSPLKIGDQFDFAAMTPFQVAQSFDQIQTVKKLIIGGGPIPQHLEDKLKVESNQIYHTYGMTETISHVALRQIAPRNDSYFRALPHVSFSQGEDQRLVINAPAIGAESLLTNDIVALQDQHSFQWLGRYDNVVNSGGIKLHPEMLESKIRLPKYSYFLAAMPDPDLGQKLILVVELDEPLKSEELNVAFSQLSRFEKPREVFYLPQFDYTSNGKLQREATMAKIR